MINTYSLLLSDDKLPYLKKESSIDYAGDCKMQTPAAIVDMVNSCFKLQNLAEEHVIMLALDAKKRIIGLFDTSHGSLASAECSPNNILKRALLCNASTLIVVHNHPSGDVDPSHDDIIVSENIKEAGKLIGIKLDDFIIIGGDEYYSFFAKDLL